MDLITPTVLLNSTAVADVRSQRRLANASGDDEKIMKWMDSNRKELGGMPMDRVLEKAAKAGFDTDSATRAYNKLLNSGSDDSLDEDLMRLPEERKNDMQDGWPSKVDMKVIQPGLVRYSDLQSEAGEMVTGEIYADREFFDKIAASLAGKPIINWDHRAVDPKEFGKGRFQGIIIGPAVFNPEDGWYHAEGYVWDDATRKNIIDGYSISCAYTVSEWGDGPGTLHQVPYLNKPVNGAYTHIAVVHTPRYEDAKIELLNSTKGGPLMGIMKLFRKDKSEEGTVDIAKTTIKIGGSVVPLSELVNSWKEKQALTAVSDDQQIEIDGKMVSIKELRNNHEEKMNADESVKMDNAHNSGDHESVPMDNCARCNAIKNAAEEEKKNKAEEDEKERMNAEKEKEEMEKKNAAEDAKKKDEERKNSLETDEAKKRAAALDERRNQGGKFEAPTILTMTDRAEEGRRRYGTVPAGTK